jgi:6-phosphogluconolactonase/glucosamine-6-phosphate isomerase/deaminase
MFWKGAAARPSLKSQLGFQNQPAITTKPTCGKNNVSPDHLPEILIYPDAAALAQAACEQITSVCAGAIARRQRCSLALCGGSTPRAIYALLGQEPYTTILDWKLLHVFWGDERLVPPEHPDSNYLLAKEHLLSHLPIA